ncbi:MAG TPA: APC family permease [Longimicrobium sp.]
MTEATVAATEHRLIRALGTWALAASIVNVTVGGGIFRLPAEMARLQGNSALWAYVVCALAMGLIVLCFADAGSRVSLTGGPYAYVETAFGPFVGFLSGVLLWAVGTFALAAVSTVLADSVAALVPALGSTAAKAGVLVVAYTLLAWVNIGGVKQGARLNDVATVAKLLPLLVLVAAGAFAIRPDYVAATAPDTGGLARACIVLIFAFAGVESALVPSGEVRNPARTVPRAILTAMLGITLLYLALHAVAQGVLGSAALGATATPLADAAGRALGPGGRALILVGTAISTFGYVSGMMLAVPRAPFAMARDGFLPRKLASVHPRFHTPHIAIAFQAVITCALAVSSQFILLAVLANLSTLLLYAACCVAAWELRRRGVATGGGTPFRVPAAPVIPWLALAVIGFMLFSVTLTEWAWVIGVLAAAAAIFFITRGSRAARV